MKNCPIFAYLAVCALAHGQLIHVEQSGSDTTGISFAYHLKEAISSSKRFALYDKTDNAIVVHIESMDRWFDGQTSWQPDKGSISYISVIAFVSSKSTTCPDSLSEALILHKLFTVGSAKTKGAAETILAQIDKAWDMFVANSQSDKSTAH